jgi:hypothetical protein
VTDDERRQDHRSRGRRGLAAAAGVVTKQKMRPAITTIAGDGHGCIGMMQCSMPLARSLLRYYLLVHGVPLANVCLCCLPVLFASAAQ